MFCFGPKPKFCSLDLDLDQAEQQENSILTEVGSFLNFLDPETDIMGERYLYLINFLLLSVLVKRMLSFLSI